MDVAFHSMLAALPGHAVLFLYGFLFALAEIEIEGAAGWAEALPTWYRVRPWYARCFRAAMANKPLTGYHAIMLPLTFLSFHVGFAFGQPFSLAAELTVMARYFFWIIVWDVLWFIFNPPFGWHRFRPGEVWWLGRGWFLGLPQEYWGGTIMSFVLAALAGWRGSPLLNMAHHAGFCLTLVVLTMIASLGVGPYQRWYRHMRRPNSDERHLAIPRAPKT